MGPLQSIFMSEAARNVPGEQGAAAISHAVTTEAQQRRNGLTDHKPGGQVPAP
ncbi:MAG: hypothetical protein L6Q57_07605 [Alphaproteobacteria bacterium]|nr:hypothetical protein [Alphaproteobacteria bacterium]